VSIVRAEPKALRDCPRSPNCVCSECDSPKHLIEPLAYSGARDQAMKTLVAHLGQLHGVNVRKVEGRYLHATFSSKLFRFVDDVEFLFCDQTPMVKVRSASRVGWSDFGANRKRINQLRAIFV
jgi:uncharacterized protein (DUF1499 family)